MLVSSLSWQLSYFSRLFLYRTVYTVPPAFDFYNYTMRFLHACSFKESLTPRHTSLSVKNNRKENTTGMLLFSVTYNLVSANQQMPKFPSVPVSTVAGGPKQDRTPVLEGSGFCSLALPVSNCQGQALCLSMWLAY